MPIAITPKLLTAYNEGQFPKTIVDIHVITLEAAAKTRGLISDLHQHSPHADSLLATIDWQTEALVIYSEMGNSGGGMVLQGAAFNEPDQLTLELHILTKPPDTPSFGTEFKTTVIYRISMPATPTKVTVKVNGQPAGYQVTVN